MQSKSSSYGKKMSGNTQCHKGGQSVHFNKSMNPFKSLREADLRQYPISEKIPEICDSLAHSSVVNIGVQTGCGKTLLVPLIVADFLSKNKGFQFTKMMVSIPLVTSTQIIYKYVGKQFPSLASIIGSKCEGVETENFYEKKIQYMTTRTVLNQLLYYLKFSFRKINGLVIVIDEIHQSSDENRVLTRLCNWLLKEGFSIKVIMMSATAPEIDPRLTYLASCSPITLNKTSFPITVKNTEKSLIRVHDSHVGDTAVKHYEVDLNGVIAKIVEMIIYYDQHRPDGTILVFVNGSDMMTKIKKRLGSSGVLLKRGIFTISATSSFYEKEQALMRVDKILIATNFIESGVTLDDVPILIDSCLENSSMTIDGVKVLNTQPISQASAIQRTGRVGRTCPGEVFRVIREAEFLKLEHQSVLEPLKDLQNLCMDFIGTGADVCEVLDITREDFDTINHKLEELGYTSCGRLTTRGSLARKLKFEHADIKNMMTILLERKYDSLLKLILIIAFAYIDTAASSSVFRIPSDIDPEDIPYYYSSEYGNFQSSSDIESGIMIIVSMMVECCDRPLSHNANFTKTFKDWCIARKLNASVVKDIFEKIIGCVNVYDISFFRGQKRRPIDMQEWQTLFQMCSEREITPLLQRELLEMAPEKIFTSGLTGFTNGKIRAFHQKFSLNQDLYDNSKILAFSCFGKAICGSVQKFTLGIILPFPTPLTSEASEASYDDDDDGCDF